MTKDKVKIIRNIYLYLVALVGIVVVIIGSINLVNTGIKYFVLGAENLSDNYQWQVDSCYGPENSRGIAIPEKLDPEGGKVVEKTDAEIEECVERAKKRSAEVGVIEAKRDISLAIAMLLVGIPVWLYHWKTIQKDHGRA